MEDDFPCVCTFSCYKRTKFFPFFAANGFANFLYQGFNKKLFIICLKLLCASTSHQVFLHL